MYQEPELDLPKPYIFLSAFPSKKIFIYSPIFPREGNIYY